MALPSDAPVRVRFAPSPTGLLHIGGLRTALYNYLFARRLGGAFLLRIEDTDQERFVAEAEPDILGALAWAGLAYDEGPGAGGAYGPYRQSERRALYGEAAEALLAGGHAYVAFDTPEEIEAMRARFQTDDNPLPKYDAQTRAGMRNALTMPPEEVAARLRDGAPHVVRLKTPPRETVRFEDMIRGWVTFETTGLDDQVLIKSDGLPTYHLANIVDDHHMRVTHVIRGEEWLPSTPKHLLLYAALGWEPPRMAHLPLILSPSGGKLSKRNADQLGIPVSVRQYREAGYDPGALLNFLAFLGWNPGAEQELFSLDELVEAFRIERVGSSGVQFNLDKLNWYNQQYVKRMPAEALAAAARPAVEARGFAPAPDYLARVADLMRERITFPKELAEAAYFFEDPTAYEEAARAKRWKADAPALAAAYADAIERLEPFDAAHLEAALRALAEAQGVGAGKIIHPVRLAVSGVSFGPGLFELLETLGRDCCVRRLRAAAAGLAPA